MPENTPASVQTNPLQGLDEDIQQMLHDWHVPGLAVGIVKDDEVVFAKGYGVKNVDEGQPVNEHTIFGVASVTKSFTAACVGILVDEGRVRWDDLVIQHLPNFQLYDPYVTREITIRDLLCARSGLVGGDLMRYGPGYDRDEVVRRLRYLKPGAGFRTTQGSYTFMFLVAGQLVAAVTGQSWDEFIRERIFSPLGMNASRTLLAETLQGENLATPHVELDGKLESTFWLVFDNTGPAGSITSNVVEIAQWLRLHLNDGRYNDQQVLSSAVMREMHTPHIVDHSALARSLNSEAHIVTYGLGWHISDYHSRKMVEHGGAGYGMSAKIAMLPEERLGLIILLNTTYTSQLFEAIKFRIFDSYLLQYPQSGSEKQVASGRSPRLSARNSLQREAEKVNGPALSAARPDWNTKALEAYRQQREHMREFRINAHEKLEAQHIAGTQPAFALELYTGTYEDEFYGKATVRYEEGHLVFDYGLVLVSDLAHWHYDTFLANWRKPFYGEDLVTFTLNAEGKVEEMKITDLATFKRIA
jgi:CubicO group peptidase (beta-lactamase class C family)